ncbi:MAG: hypothetical protein KatS3mg056_3350 [Chloroflexus sp.]|jgi:hypothetical protein|nr:MAG: hypothetical protein KatS3mg056_3350 [Chloroflexus sp.]
MSTAVVAVWLLHAKPCNTFIRSVHNIPFSTSLYAADAGRGTACRAPTAMPATTPPDGVFQRPYPDACRDPIASRRQLTDLPLAHLNDEYC